MKRTSDENYCDSSKKVICERFPSADVIPNSTKKIRIAVAGCSHGQMDKIYATLAAVERKNRYKFDLLICCGDYQAVRNYGDLKHMHIKEKYRALNSFYRYYSAEVVIKFLPAFIELPLLYVLEAPVLTIFVGGNHEASGFLQELPNGGWVAPKIYYMGHASVLNFAGLRIAGLSGIYNKYHFDLGHYECPPFDNYGDLISIYHVRSVDLFRLKQLRDPDGFCGKQLDMFVSHDWPAGIVDYGDKEKLLTLKPYFEEDINRNNLGNPASMSLLYDLRPRYWLAAHLHCKFAALVSHQDKINDGKNLEPTRFLSLDKPIRGRHFLQSLEFDVDINSEMALSYDPIWLAILRSTDKLTSICRTQVYMPSHHIKDERWDFRPTEEEIEDVKRIFKSNFKIPENFRRTAKPHVPGQDENCGAELYYRNPQSSEFCRKLGISDLNEMLCHLSVASLGLPHYLSESEICSERSEKILIDVETDSEF
ncbi:unnamed protein product [Dracunculus medinensis]|uniref:DBR1 domain-containing protein n=1 Tax=Dracunculus medinensis TaxID=318479 RepID=A0A0N4UH33_DRAME|nr:unnamed protein product [Dracunculus medinensis]